MSVVYLLSQPQKFQLSRVNPTILALQTWQERSLLKSLPKELQTADEFLADVGWSSRHLHAPEGKVGPGINPSVWHSKSQPGLSPSPEEGVSTSAASTRSL